LTDFYSVAISGRNINIGITTYMGRRMVWTWTFL